MPSVNFFGVPVVILSKVDNIDLDVATQVTVTEQSLVTKNPTENGANITDHVVNQPTTISIRGRFTDTPLATGSMSFPNPAAGILARVSSGKLAGLSVRKWNSLEVLKRKRVPFIVSIQHGIYENMIIEHLTGPRDPGDGSSMKFQLDMVQIQMVDLLSLLANSSSADTEHTSRNPGSLGNQSAVQF